MGELSRENFYAKIATAPRAVQGFFETVIEHFNTRNDIHAHHTDTNGGDLRLALPAELARHHTIRNFSTLYWQSRNQEIFVRSYLTPEEMAVFGFAGVKIPRNINEPLHSELRLGEQDWRYRAQDFIRASEAAALKMME
jgi:hypothetical protein